MYDAKVESRGFIAPGAYRLQTGSICFMPDFEQRRFSHLHLVYWLLQGS